MWRDIKKPSAFCIIFISYILMHRDGSSVMFPLGSWGVLGLATSDPLTQMTQLALILLQLPSRQLTCASTQGQKKKMTTEKALYIILQKPIRAKLYWWLLNISFKNREATLLLLLCHNDVVIRLFVHSGMYFFFFFFLQYRSLKNLLCCLTCWLVQLKHTLVVAGELGFS